MDSKITSYKKDVLLALEGATDELLAKLAIVGEGKAKVNIRDNGQIDTGFMVNSVFHIRPGGESTYATARSEAEKQTYSSKRGAHVDHSGDMAPEPRLPDKHTAAICCGASYGIYQENQSSFMYRAAEQLKGEVGGVIQEVARDIK